MLFSSVSQSAPLGALGHRWDYFTTLGFALLVIPFGTLPLDSPPACVEAFFGTALGFWPLVVCPRVWRSGIRFIFGAWVCIPLHIHTLFCKYLYLVESACFQVATTLVTLFCARSSGVLFLPTLAHTYIDSWVYITLPFLGVLGASKLNSL